MNKAEITQAQLAAWWEEQTGIAANGNTPYYNWVATAGAVADVVRGSGTYSTNPGQQPVNRDFVEYFLTESNEGYCVHLPVRRWPCCGLWAFLRDMRRDMSCGRVILMKVE